MTQRKRPLSPHLSIYRSQLSSFVSVLQRITGGALLAGLAAFVYWLGSAAYGPAAYATALNVLTSWLGWLVLLGVTVALYFHLFNGIRHLIWDIGYGFEIHQVKIGALLVLGGTAVFSALTWLAVLLRMGVL